MGFIRRFSAFPGLNVIEQIEGINIIDLPPPGSISGVAEGVVCLVGEFPDVTYGVTVNPSTGVVSTNPQPVAIYGAQDMLNKVGGFDPTIGDTGVSGGNGFIALQSKQFSALVIIPINIASSNGARLYRALPTNVSATVPTPVVFVQGGSVAAGTQFLSSGDLVNLAQLTSFTASQGYASGADGATSSESTATTQTLSSAGGNFLTCKNGGPVQVGDAIVVGVIGAGGAQGSFAATYRVNTVTSNTALVLELQSGASFVSPSGSSLAWRLHQASDADTGGQTNLASIGPGYTIPARPITASIAASTVLPPLSPAAAATATSWVPLSGLNMATMPSGGAGGGGLTYASAVQAPNAVSASAIDALYFTAMQSLLQRQSPQNTVDIVFCARYSSNIRNYLNTLVNNESAIGLGMMGVVSPELSVQTSSAALASADPGVNANRSERLVYSWPGVQISVPAAVGYNLIGADGSTQSGGQLDVHAAGFVAAAMSNLAPELSIAQTAEPIATVLSPVLNLQRGVTGLQIGDYIALKAGGVCGFVNTGEGFFLQSAITTSLTSGQTDINRRRMADFIEDSLGQGLQPLSNLPIGTNFQDAAIGEVNGFLVGLQSPNNPNAQRINAYSIDPVNGNTEQTLAQGVYVLIVQVQMTPIAKYIVLTFQIGPGVFISSSTI